MSTDKEDMVNGSSSTSRVSSNFVLARTAPLVHSTPRLTECNRFLQLENLFLSAKHQTLAGSFIRKTASGAVCSQDHAASDAILGDDSGQHGTKAYGIRGTWSCQTAALGGRCAR